MAAGGLCGWILREGMTESEGKEKQARGGFVSGAVWMVAMRWAMRLIGLVSTVILARLLTPDDFGVVALALIVNGFLDVVSWTGVDLALIRDRNATREHYDTAWTIQIIQGCIYAALLVAAAPLAAAYFDEPRTAIVLYLFAFRAIVEGFQNIGVVAFRRDLNFATEFRFGLYKKLLSFSAVVILAFTLRNYLALALGMVAAALAGVIISYLMHDYRPRFCVKRMRDIWSFSQWMMISRLGRFFNEKTDQFIVGGIAGTQTMGLYHMSSELGTMPTVEVVMPLRRSLFPNFSTQLDQPDLFGRTILKVLGIIAVVAFAAGFGLSGVAVDFVPLVLGDRWLAAIPLMEWLALFGVAAGLSSSMELLLLVTNKGHLSALEAWGQLLVLAPALWYAAHHAGIVDVAMTRAGVAWLFVPLMMFLLTRAAPVGFYQLLGVFWRPAIAALAMLTMLRVLHIDAGFVVLSLLANVLFGAAVFIVTLLLLWRLAGRPEGVESMLVGAIAKLTARLRPRSSPAA